MGSLWRTMFIASSIAPHVGHYFGLGRRVAFCEEDAELFSYATQSTKKYSVLPFFPPEMPPQYAFMAKKRIKWLLESGYEPAFVHSPEGNLVISFAPNGSLKEVLTKDCIKIQSLLDDRGQQEQQLARLNKDAKGVLWTLLSEYLKNLKDDKFEIAKSCIEKALEVSRNAIVIKRLFADTLFFLKDRAAASEYLALHKLSNDPLDLERAILCSPEDREVIKRVKKCRASEEVARSLQLVGYVASKGLVKDYRQEIGDLELLAEIKFCTDKRQKKELQRQLAEVARQQALSRISSESSPVIRLRKQIEPLVRNTAGRRSPTLKALSESLSSIRRFSQDSELLDLAESGARRVRREELIKEIDKLIQEKKHDEASKKIEEAITEYREWGLLYERRAYILPKCSADYFHEETDNLSMLLVDKTLAPEKREYVARVLFDRQPVFAHGRELAECYAARGNIQGSVRLYYRLATMFQEHAETSLVRIYQLDSSYSHFSEKELKMLYLLSLTKDTLGPDPWAKSPRREDLQPVLASGETCYVCLDHPEYIASWMSLEEQFLFTKDHVEIREIGRGKKTKCLLHFPQDVPIEMRLFRASAIQWLLHSGFRPIQTDGGCTFTKEPPESREHLILQMAEKEALKLKSPYLYDFIGYFKKKNYGLAHAAIQPLREEVVELYAEFLAFLKHPDAIQLYRQMVGKNSEEKRFFVRRALSLAVSLRSPTAYTIYVELAKLLPEEEAKLLYLHGYLYFTLRSRGEKYAQECFVQADPALRTLARIACSQDVQGKEEGFKELASGSPYYKAKLASLQTSLVEPLSDLLDEMVREKGNVDLEKTFTLPHFCEMVQQIKRETRKLPAGDLPDVLEDLERAMEEKRFIDAERVLVTMKRLELPEQFEAKVAKLYELYERSKSTHILNVEQIVSLQLPTLPEICEKCKKIEGGSARSMILLDRFLNQLSLPDDFKSAEITLLEVRNCAPGTIRHQIDDLYIHFLLFLKREEVVDFCLEYLDKKEQANDRSSDRIRTTRGQVGVKNSLYVGLQSERLYYLELLLELVFQNRDQAVSLLRVTGIYKKIIETFEERKLDSSIVALHAVLYLRNRDVQAARVFLDKIDPKHPLKPQGLLALLPLEEKGLRREAYMALIGFFEDQARVKEYRASCQKSSLYAYVHGECKSLLAEEHITQVKKIGLVFIDTLIERGCYSQALEMKDVVCTLLNSFDEQRVSLPHYSYYPSERFPGERFSILKREVVCLFALGKKRGVEQALTQLEKLYEEAGKAQMAHLSVKLAFKLTKSKSAFRKLLCTSAPQVKAVLCFENAIRSIVSQNCEDAKESLAELQTFDPKFELFTEDERLMLYQMVHLTTVDVAQRESLESLGM